MKYTGSVVRQLTGPPPGQLGPGTVSDLAGQQLLIRQALLGAQGFRMGLQLPSAGVGLLVSFRAAKWSGSA